jgi:hypothetical protein
MQLQIKRSENQDMSGCTLKKKAYVFHMITSECMPKEEYNQRIRRLYSTVQYKYISLKTQKELLFPGLRSKRLCLSVGSSFVSIFVNNSLQINHLNKTFDQSLHLSKFQIISSVSSAIQKRSKL